MRLTSSQLDDVQLAIDLDKAQYLAVSSNNFTREEIELISEARTRCLVEKVLAEEVHRRQLGGELPSHASLSGIELPESVFEQLAAGFQIEEHWAAAALFGFYRQVVAERHALGGDEQSFADETRSGSTSGLHLISGGRERELEPEQQVNQSVK